MFIMQLSKEAFKFSCSHFTILSAERAERLHGHNYHVRVAIGIEDLDPHLGLAFDFNEVKPKIRTICDELDERILLPAKSPYLKQSDQAGQVKVQFAQKTYMFPSEDVLLLPLVNVTAEELARYFCERLAKMMAHLPYRRLRVEIAETRGQSVSYVYTSKS